jgi:hypothetical protein
MHVTVPPTARRGRGDSQGATRAADGIPMMLPTGMVGDTGVSMNDAHMNDNTKSCRVYSFPAQLLDIIEDEDALDADAPPPPHAALVNYPTGSASERRARINPSNPNRKKGANGKTPNPNQQHCVMCGRGTESDNIVIPVQNKQVCTDCDTGVWLFKADKTYFKWCKGCKRFRSIHAFREKLQGLRGATRTTCLPSKCDSCRCRGRLGYRAKKEAVLTTFKSEDGQDGQDGQQVQNGSNRSASLDALLLTGLANSSSSENGNVNENGEMNQDESNDDQDSGEGGPNKKQKRSTSLKPAGSKSSKDMKSTRGRKGKNVMGMQLPLGLTMPMGLPSDMNMQMGMLPGMMPSGLPLSFHHAMYLQQQANGGAPGSSSSSSSGTTGNTGEEGETMAIPGNRTAVGPNGTNVPLLYNSPFSQQLVECLMKMPMYANSTQNTTGAPPPLHSAESTVAAATAAAVQQLQQQQPAPPSSAPPQQLQLQQQQQGGHENVPVEASSSVEPKPELQQVGV